MFYINTHMIYNYSLLQSKKHAYIPTLNIWMSAIMTLFEQAPFFSDDYILICIQVLPNNDSCSSDSNFFPSFLPSHPGAPGLCLALLF